MTVFVPVVIVSFVSSDTADQSQLFCRNPDYVSPDGSPVDQLPDLFPEDFGRPIDPRNPELSQLENDEIADWLSEHTKEWYSEHLVAACETSLFDPKPLFEPDETVIRFLWLRSFDPTVVVRVHLKSDGTSWMVAKELTGLGGYDAGKMASRIERNLNENEQKRIRQFLEKSKFFDQKPYQPTGGFDGAQWVFEKSDKKGYSYVDRWSPTSGDAYEFGVFFLKLTGWYSNELAND